MAKEPSIQIPISLLREIQRGNCIPLIGSGVASEADVGIPSAWALALKLAKECELMDSDYYKYEEHQHDKLDKVAEDFILIADKVTGERGRARLEEILQREVPRTGNRHPKVGKSSYPFIVNIPWQKVGEPLIITTNWDDLLEDAIVKYTEAGCVVILENADLPDVVQDHSKVKIIKLHGTIGQPETLVVTQSDYLQAIERIRTVGPFEYVAGLLATRTLLFAGYSLRDSNFQFLYELVDKATKKAGRSSTPTHYAILGEKPDAYEKAKWEKKGIIFLPLTAQEFFRQVFIETNKFINRDEQRRLNRLEYAPIYAIVGPAGVGKSTLLRRINDDLELDRNEQVRRYRHHLLYTFPRPESLTPESRCFDLLSRLAKELNYPLPDIISEARQKADKEQRSESELREELFNYHLDQLKLRFSEPTLLLFDCTTRLNPTIVQVLERFIEPALGGGLRAIIASRYPLEWTHHQLKRIFRANTEKLLPFTENNVVAWLQFQSLLEADTFLEENAVKEAARRVIQLTCGHPEAIKLVMSRLSEDPAKLQDKQRIVTFIQTNEQELIENIVHEVVEKQILSDVDEVLQKILSDLLCVFRKVNANVLEALVDSALDQSSKEALQKPRDQLLGGLTTYYLAAEPSGDSPMYTLDPVLRRLLAHHLESRERDRFIELNETAACLFEEWANLWTADFQRMAIHESMYHLLHLARLAKGGVEARFQDYVNKVSPLLNRLEGPAGVSIRQDLVRQLHNQLENDQEFAEDFVMVFGPDRYSQLLATIQ